MIKQAGAIYKHFKDHGLPFRLWRVQKNCFCKPSPFLLTFSNTKDALRLTPQVSSVLPRASQLSGTALTKTYIKYSGLGVCRAWVKYLFHQRVTHDYPQGFLFIFFSVRSPFQSSVENKQQMKSTVLWNLLIPSSEVRILKLVEKLCQLLHFKMSRIQINSLAKGSSFAFCVFT